MHFDDLLVNHVGEWGKAQTLIFIAVSLTNIPLAFNGLGIVFLAATPDHWCRVPELEHLNLTREDLKNLTIPLENNGGVWAYSSCHQYDINVTGWDHDDVEDAMKQDGQEKWGTAPCRYGWNYDFSVYTSTIVSQWDLVCDRSWLQATTSSVYMAGYMIGLLCLGTVSDMFGRLPTVWASLILTITFSVAAAFPPNVVFFMIFRFFVAVFAIATLTTAYVLLMEMVGPSYRVLAGTGNAFTFSAFQVVLSGIAYGIRDWHLLQLTFALIPIVFILFFWYLPESPRWLYVQEKADKANKIIIKMIRINNKGDIPEHLDVHVEKKQKAYMWDLLKTTHLRSVTINMCFQWCVTALVYYGISLGSSNLGGNDYVNCFITAAVELPAYALGYVLMIKAGRRITLGGALIAGGVVMLCSMAVPKELNWLAITIAMFGKFCVTVAFHVLYIYTVELFPTILRNTAMGCCSMSARIGAIVSPYVIQLAMISRFFPFTVYGALCASVAVLTIFLPETKGQRLPETLEDGEAFSKRRHRPSILRNILKKPVN